MSGIETQARLMLKSNQIRDELKKLNDWEKDMKHQEAKRTQALDDEAFNRSYPIRNQMQTSKPSTSAASTPTENESVEKSQLDEKSKADENVQRAAVPNAIEKANEFKTRGNDCVKAGQYQKAIHYYTEAIRLNKSEAVYYTNRALCYLKQSKFIECIDDCTAAIDLDDKAVKAYYRRMQAREQMKADANGLEAALADCSMVLRIEPSNTDALKGLVRIQSSLKSLEKQAKHEETMKKQEQPWSQYDGKDGCDRIEFVTKEPHLRSKQPLKRIAIIDSHGKSTAVPVAIDSNRTTDQNITSKSFIDQTTDQNESTTRKATEPNKSTTNQSQVKKISIDVVIPKTSAQFYKTWKSIEDDNQKFTILKGIYNTDISKMLGAQLDLDLLREMFKILKTFFISQNLPIVNILRGIVKNSEMYVVSAMMNDEDTLAFTKLVEYMRIRGEDAKKIDAIQKTFDDLLSM